MPDDPLLAVLLDIERAYDGVVHDVLELRLFQCGLPVPLVALAMLTTRGFTTVLADPGGLRSGPVAIDVGLRQGGVCSPLLYLLYTAAQTQSVMHAIPVVARATLPALSVVDAGTGGVCASRPVVLDLTTMSFADDGVMMVRMSATGVLSTALQRVSQASLSTFSASKSVVERNAPLRRIAVMFIDRAAKAVFGSKEFRHP